MVPVSWLCAKHKPVIPTRLVGIGPDSSSEERLKKVLEERLKKVKCVRIGSV
jgi:hypothetical protein